MQVIVGSRPAYQLLVSDKGRLHIVFLEYLEGCQHTFKRRETALILGHFTDRRIIFQHTNIGNVPCRSGKDFSPGLEVMGHGTARDTGLLGNFLGRGLGITDIDQTLHGRIQNMHAHQVAFFGLPAAILRLATTWRSAQWLGRRLALFSAFHKLSQP